MKFIADIQAGQTVKIKGFHAQVRSHFPHYLSLGLIPGALVRVLRSAPFGGPMQVEIGSTVFSLRRLEAQMIVVEDL